jgi:hypothetical protein
MRKIAHVPLRRYGPDLHEKVVSLERAAERKGASQLGRDGQGLEDVILHARAERAPQRHLGAEDQPLGRRGLQAQAAEPTRNS